MEREGAGTSDMIGGFSPVQVVVECPSCKRYGATVDQLHDACIVKCKHCKKDIKLESSWNEF